MGLDHHILITQSVNLMFLVIPMIQLVKTLHGNTPQSRGSPFLSIIEYLTIISAFSIYLVINFLTSNTYMVVYFVLQLIFNGSLAYRRFRCLKKDDIYDKSDLYGHRQPAMNERGVLLQHEQPYYDSVLQDSQNLQKKTSQQLDFYISETENDNDIDDQDIEGFGSDMDSERVEPEHRNRFKLNLPVLATLLLLSPVQTELAPVLQDTIEVREMGSYGWSMITAGSDTLEMIAFSLILLSKLSLILGLIQSLGTNRQPIKKRYIFEILQGSCIPFIQLALILLIIPFQSPGLFAFQNGSSQSMLYCLLGFNGIIFCESFYLALVN